MKKATQLDNATQENVNKWLNGNYDSETKRQVSRLLEENPQEVVDAFYTALTFGTGGLRGVMGVGSNRMNVYTVRAATQGLANYINKLPKSTQTHSVFIGYDTRYNSRLFAEESAKVLAANGIKVYIFSQIRPTPLVSFGCRYKKCLSGIMITASHNPAAYNGYKVFWDDGGQILPPHDARIIEEVGLVNDPSQVRAVDGLNDPLIEWIDEEIDTAYFRAIEPLQNYLQESREFGHELKVVYSSLHGVGISIIPRALSNWGFTNLRLVEKQVIPDGRFPTVDYPNPEEKEALRLGIQELEAIKGDLLIATDPDADRVGVAVRHKDEVRILTGNQVACLCLDYVCRVLIESGRMPSGAAFVKTIVTTELFSAIAAFYKKPCFDVLTGFKYIAQKIHEWELDPSQGYQFLFGGEESYGYLLGTQVRDKDAVVMSALICEMTLHAKRQGKTLVDLLHGLYARHGVFFETLFTIGFKETKEGKEQMAVGIKKLQDSPPSTLCDLSVVALENYQQQLKTDFRTGKVEPITLPKSDVLLFWLEDGSKVVVRPSGTEPKIKIYCGVKEPYQENVEQALANAKAKAEAFTASLKDSLTKS